MVCFLIVAFACLRNHIICVALSDLFHFLIAKTGFSTHNLAYPRCEQQYAFQLNWCGVDLHHTWIDSENVLLLIMDDSHLLLGNTLTILTSLLASTYSATHQQDRFLRLIWLRRIQMLYFWLILFINTMFTVANPPLAIHKCNFKRDFTHWVATARKPETNRTLWRSFNQHSASWSERIQTWLDSHIGISAKLG